MSTIPFDTLRFVNRLVDAGMPQKQAEEIVRAAIDAADGLATKQDIKALEAKMESQGDKIVIRVGVMLFAVAGLAVAGAKLL